MSGLPTTMSPLPLAAPPTLPDLIARLLAILLPVRDGGATSLCAEYAGSGDEGSIQAVHLGGAGAVMLALDVPAEAFDLLEELQPPGYGNDEGGYGEIHLDLWTGRLRIEHSDYVLDVRESMFEFIPAGVE
jgi:hypothetical protein